MIKAVSEAVRDGFLFQFHAVKDKLALGGGNYYTCERNDFFENERLQKQNMIYACGALSVFWVTLILAYGLGMAQSVFVGGIPLFAYASLAIIALFPVAMIWGGYFIYTRILLAQQTGNAILEAARILGSPALLAADDVQTLSAAVNGELDGLKRALRELEENLAGVQNGVRTEIESLREAGDFLGKTMNETSGKIFRERDNIIELMKLVRNELRLKEPAPGSAGAAYLQRLQQAAEEAEEKSRIAAPAQQQTPPTEETNDITEPPRPAQFTPEQITAAEREHPESFILRAERHLYEGLYSLTSDLNRALQTEAPQDFWPRYMRGEKSVFADYLCEWARRNPEVYERNRKSDGFKQLARRFITQFETLRQRLFDTPHPTVSEYLEKSGPGKIYTLLSSDYA